MPCIPFSPAHRLNAETKKWCVGMGEGWGGEGVIICSEIFHSVSRVTPQRKGKAVSAATSLGKRAPQIPHFFSPSEWKP